MPKVELLTDHDTIIATYEFIQSQNLSYPDYDAWAKKCRDELLLGYKKAFTILIPDKDRRPVVAGSVIVQTHKTDNSVLEIKNGRINPDYENKGYFKKIYLDVERYARQNGYKKIILDAHADNFEVITLMQKLGFVIECKENLYTSKTLELVMTKYLSLTRIQALEAVVADSIRKALIILKAAILRFLKLFLVLDS